MQFELHTMMAEGDKVVCIGIIAAPTTAIPRHTRYPQPTATHHIHVLTFDQTALITEHLAVRDDVTVLRQPRIAQQSPPPRTGTTPSSSENHKRRDPE